MHPLPDDIAEIVATALKEDVGNGDRTAQLINPDASIHAELISREPAIICGIAWFNEVFRQLDTHVRTNWLVRDGDKIQPDQSICTLEGPARPILTGERTAINFLQTLSGTATLTNEYVNLISGTGARLLDTRKTMPGLRSAQKYAVLCGGGKNHRMGLYDAILIKENHKLSCGNLVDAIKVAKKQNVPVQAEVETLEELETALAAGCESILLDNFTLDDLYQAVKLNKGRAKLEASGGINKDNIRSVAETGVDFISIGSLTKHIRAIDFSLRFMA